MLFTTKAEYGVRLLIRIGLSPDRKPLSLKSIADSEQLPLAYLERIVALLKSAGLVSATRGPQGGYRLNHDPNKLTMERVVLALEGEITPMECFADRPIGRIACAHRDNTDGCATRWLWRKVKDGMIDTLAGTTLADLISFAHPHSTQEKSQAKG